MDANQMRHESGVLLGGWPFETWERDWATNTTSTMQKEFEGIESWARELYPYAKQTFCNTVTVVAMRLSTERDPMDIGEFQFAKHYWHELSRSTLDPRGLAGYALVFEAPEDQLGHPEDVVASTPPWPPLWQPDEPKPSVWRGLFSPTYSRKILFSIDLGVTTAELLRWKPHVPIDRRTLEREDE